MSKLPIQNWLWCMWGGSPAPTSVRDVHQSRLWQLNFLHPSWLCWVSHSLSWCLAWISQALAAQHPCSLASLERTDLCVGTLRSQLQLAPKFQKCFKGCFLLVLTVGFLIPVAAAFSLPIFPIKRGECCHLLWEHCSSGVPGVSLFLVGWCILKGHRNCCQMSFPSHTLAMRTLMPWMGEMMAWKSSKQFWLWLLLFWRFLGKHYPLLNLMSFAHPLL